MDPIVPASYRLRAKTCTALTVILLLVILAIFQYTHYRPLLPAQVASHFNGAGVPDEWTSKSAFLVGSLALVVGFAVLFLGLTGVVQKIPNDWINMPNKDYWLAPARRAETMSQLRQMMEWLGAATLALLVAIAQLTIEANLAGRGLDNRSFWIVFGTFMIAMVTWLVVILRWAYQRPSRSPEER